MPKLVLFRCRRFALDDVAKVIEVDDLEGVVRELADDKPVVLIGPEVSSSDASDVINAVASSGACFLCLRKGTPRRGCDDWFGSPSSLAKYQRKKIAAAKQLRRARGRYGVMLSTLLRDLAHICLIDAARVTGEERNRLTGVADHLSRAAAYLDSLEDEPALIAKLERVSGIASDYRTQRGRRRSKRSARSSRGR